MRIRPVSALLLVATALAGWTAHAAPAPAEWAHWRGPNRNGVTTASSGWTGSAWPRVPAVWKLNVGEASAPPVVAGGRVYVAGWRNKQEELRCLDAATGKAVWEVAYPCPQYSRLAIGHPEMYSGPGASPELDTESGLLYTISADGDLNCWDTRKNGHKVWGFNLTDKYHVTQRPQATARKNTLRDFGLTSSPLLFGEWVVVEVGSAEGNLMAFSKRTGQRAWVSEDKTPAGHTGGPVPITVEGVPCIAVLTLHSLLVVRTDAGHEGKTATQYEWTTDYACNISTPTVVGDSVLITSAHNKSSTCRLKVTLQGISKVWEQKVYTRECSPVVYHGHVYLTFNGLLCLDWETGETKWDGGRFGDASSLAVTGDGRIVVWANNGDLALVESADRSPDAYKELAMLKGQGEAEAWPHVVLAEGRAFCRDRVGNLKCFALR